jgi:hypothetical protein
MERSQSERVLKYERNNPRAPGSVNLDAMLHWHPPMFGPAEPAETFWSLTAQRLSDVEFARSLCKRWGIDRRTWYWSPETVARFLGRFSRNELRYPVLLFQMSRQWLGVSHGFHRVSAALAWIRDDYGDGEHSRASGGTTDEDVCAAAKCRELVETTVGRFDISKHAGGSIPVEWLLDYRSRHWAGAELTDGGHARKAKEPNA